MKPIYRLTAPVPEVKAVGIYQALVNDADEPRFPVVIDGRYFHFIQGENQSWRAIGLSEDLCAVISEVIVSKKLIDQTEQCA